MTMLIKADWVTFESSIIHNKLGLNTTQSKLSINDNNLPGSIIDDACVTPEN